MLPDLIASFPQNYNCPVSLWIFSYQLKKDLPLLLMKGTEFNFRKFNISKAKRSNGILPLPSQEIIFSKIFRYA